MKILLKREFFTEHSTIGRMFINNEFMCYTLEDVDRRLELGENKKIAGKTAIPRGTYAVVVSFSNRFQTVLPLLVDVPMFSGIRIHPGNTDQDTEGCILTGVSTGINRINDSRKAFNLVFGAIDEAFKKREYISITVL